MKCGADGKPFTISFPPYLSSISSKIAIRPANCFRVKPFPLQRSKSSLIKNCVVLKLSSSSVRPLQAMIVKGRIIARIRAQKETTNCLLFFIVFSFPYKRRKVLKLYDNYSTNRMSI